MLNIEIETCHECEKKYDLNAFPVINDPISYDNFFKTYMLPNVPCLIKNVTQDWEANVKWLLKDKTPNLGYLKEVYGSCDVTLYDCNKRYFNSQKTECCKLETYLENWKKSTDLKYLKDWHLKNTFKDDNFYQVPYYFASDWLNEYLVDKSLDDYRFVYMGRAGTWTPFHADVFNSFSWSANVCGAKKWILLPPNEENSLRDPLNNLPYDIASIFQHSKHFEIIQEAGDGIFVPSGWHHQVWNLEDTISINHNWINGCNILQTWISLEENLAHVKKEIQDCLDMEGFLEHCQVMLNAAHGMDFFRFYDFLKFIATKRLETLNHNGKLSLFNEYTLGLKHIIFDLKAVRKVLEKFCQHEDVNVLFKTEQPVELLQHIIKFISINTITT